MPVPLVKVLTGMMFQMQITECSGERHKYPVKEIAFERVFQVLEYTIMLRTRTVGV